MQKLSETPLSKVIEIDGFSFAGVTAGLKQSKSKDLGLAYSDKPVTAAALFTKNSIVGAPIKLGREHILSGKVQALLVNSGHANVFTGKQGYRDCKKICKAVAKEFALPKSQWVFPSSTGRIGERLAVQKIIESLPKLKKEKSSKTKSIIDFANAILTTDKSIKCASIEFLLPAHHEHGMPSASASPAKKALEKQAAPPRKVKILGVVKGAGMLEPNMATMLAYFFTDVKASATQLQRILKQASETSFHAISVDSDTSTSDTALILASAKSGVTLKHKADEKLFLNKFESLALNLAKKIVSDGEGTKRILELTLSGAKNYKENKAIAKGVINSPLVKTALQGGDPNVGRIVMAIGKTAKDLNENEISIHFLKKSFLENASPLVSITNRKNLTKLEYKKLKTLLTKEEVYIEIQLQQKNRKEAAATAATVWGVGLSLEYLQFNSLYTT